MKHAKKLLALVITTLLALPLFCSAAFAEETRNFVVDNSSTGYTYVLYQMFTGDITENTDSQGDDDKYILTNIEWGSSVLPETRSAMYKMFKLTGEDASARGVAEAIASSTNSDIFHEMMLYMAELGERNGTSLRPFETLTLGDYDINGTSVRGYGTTGIPTGYYLVRNTGVPSGDPDATYSDYIVKVVGEDVKATVKDAKTTTVKQVKDRNDSLSSDYTEYGDAGDYDIGDSIPYVLKAQLPENYSMYDAIGYKLQFEDDMDKGLTWDGSATIHYGLDDEEGTPITFTKATGNKVKIEGADVQLNSAYDGGTVWLYTIDNLKDTAPNLEAEDIVWIEYEATLNSQAIIGVSGNSNRHRIIFSSNPTDPDLTNASSYDLNRVFTYKTVLTKYNEKREPLSGAEFKLEKYHEDGNGGQWIDVTELHGAGGINPTATVSNDHIFTFSGLGDGKYRLTETKTPAGYNTLPVQEFEITAEHDTDSDDPQLTSLVGSDAHDFTLTTDLTNATLSGEIINRPGVVLPASGSIGATIIQIAGAVLLAGAVAIGIMKRRARNA